jgi:hypothetical protein
MPPAPTTGRRRETGPDGVPCGLSAARGSSRPSTSVRSPAEASTVTNQGLQDCETTHGTYQSDWLHEREWRIPVSADNLLLHLPPDSVQSPHPGSIG